MPETWHYGLVARWWAEFNRDGPEIEYFRRFVERGQPALDVGCGTGRLLLPYLRAGLDVHGCDVSADMIALCLEQASRDGLEPTLFVTPMHSLSPPRRYRTIYVCGSFGLGSTGAQDQEALRRLYDALEPCGRGSSRSIPSSRRRRTRCTRTSGETASSSRRRSTG